MLPSLHLLDGRALGGKVKHLAVKSQKEQRESQQKNARRLITKRAAVRPQDRGAASADSDKIGILRSDKADHRRMYAVVCYTRHFDKILVAMTRNPDKDPFEIVEGFDTFKRWGKIVGALGFFDPDADSEYGTGAATIELAGACQLQFLNYDNEEAGDRRLVHVTELGVVFEKHFGIQANPEEVAYRDIEEVARFFDESMKQMWKAFIPNFTPWFQWANESVGGQSTAERSSNFMAKDKDGTPYCKALSVLFSGNRVQNPDPKRLGSRMLSTSYDIATAIGFTEKDAVPHGALMVFVLDLDVQVVNVHAVTSPLTDDFLCFEEECEIIVEQNCHYERLPTLDEFPVQQKEFEEAWDGCKKAKPPVVLFYRVSAPPEMRID